MLDFLEKFRVCDETMEFVRYRTAKILKFNEEDFMGWLKEFGITFLKPLGQNKYYIC